MELNEREVVRILKQGAEAEQEFAKRRQSILKEREHLMREASEWEKIDCEAADRLRRSVTGEDSLNLLFKEECMFHAVREALWRIDPVSRDLLNEYYGKQTDAHTLAREMCVSDSTFWRRRRSAVGELTVTARGLAEQVVKSSPMR